MEAATGLFYTHGLCPGVNRSWAQSLLPYGFYLCWLANLVLNIVWLLLWDKEYIFVFNTE